MRSSILLGLAEIMLSDAAAYCVSKAAALALSRLAAKAAGKHKIRVDVLMPGVIDTRMLWVIDGGQLVD